MKPKSLSCCSLDLPSSGGVKCFGGGPNPDPQGYVPRSDLAQVLGKEFKNQMGRKTESLSRPYRGLCQT